jgi:hypothetical protein
MHAMLDGKPILDILYPGQDTKAFVKQMWEAANPPQQPGAARGWTAQRNDGIPPMDPQNMGSGFGYY